MRCLAELGDKDFLVQDLIDAVVENNYTLLIPIAIKDGECRFVFLNEGKVFIEELDNRNSFKVEDVLVTVENNAFPLNDLLYSLAKRGLDYNLPLFINGERVHFVYADEDCIYLDESPEPIFLN